MIPSLLTQASIPGIIFLFYLHFLYLHFLSSSISKTKTLFTVPDSFIPFHYLPKGWCYILRFVSSQCLNGISHEAWGLWWNPQHPGKSIRLESCSFHLIKHKEEKLNTNLFSFVLFCFIPFTRVTLHFLANGIKQSKQKEKGTSQALCLMVHEGSVCG